MQLLHSSIISIPGSPKTWTWKLSPILPPQITEKSRNCTQSTSQEAPKIHPRIDKNGNLGLSVSIGCPPGPQDHQNGAPGTHKGAQRSQKASFFRKKWTISVVNLSCWNFNCDGLEGPAAGGEALKITLSRGRWDQCLFKIIFISNVI